MAPLLHTSARVLEFESLRDMLRAYAGSPLGQTRIAALAPSTDAIWIARQQQLTAEVREFLRTCGRFEFGGLHDIGKLLEKARIEGVALEPLELRDVITLVDRAAEWRELAFHPPSAMKAGWPAVAELSQQVADFTAFLRGFQNKLLPDGSLDDRASPELARLRREVEKQKRLIQESLRGYLRRLAEDGAVQEELITIRGERFVIPVKAEQKRRVGGVVHGASSSGQTVFVEPLETIEQNNELVRLLDDEQAEVRRILLEMTRQVREQSHAIAAAADVLAELDLQFAKARFAEDYDCVAPVMCGDTATPQPCHPERSEAQPSAVEGPQRRGLNQAGPKASSQERPDQPINQSANQHLLLRSARHPVLERNLKLRDATVVPLTLELDAAHRQLVITGPNTGGKTVALKTVGLLALMAQSGVPVPATQAQLPVFDAVLADIGDYQSIEQNLSTFSAHVTNIDFISRTATACSLVLLDELGSATDPEEGAALAVAIADHFRQVGAVSIISTHHTSLKVYGANTAGVLNAAVGFDERTLQPTYELKVGVPGASAGINIAQRLGLNADIIAAARQRMGSQAQDVSRFLDRLHAELRDAAEKRAALEQRAREVERESKRLEAEGLKEQRARVREMEKKLEAVLHDFEYRARETVNAVQERAAALKLSKDAERRIAKLRREFKDQFDTTVVAHTSGADAGDPNARPTEVKYVEEGDTVKLKSLGRPAVVRRRLGEDSFEVEAGAMKMKIARSDIAEVLSRAAQHAGDNPVQAARRRGISVSMQEEKGSAPTEINVIGETVDEATRRVERFVDRAFLAGLPRVRIVHGSGMGKLRKALREYLKAHPHVATVAEPPQNEGGAGATVVELRL